MARPLKNISDEQIEQVSDLAFDGCRTREIAAIMDLPETTVRRRFGALITKKRAERRHKLRKLQLEAAQNGNATMLVWLGKQELDQTDKPTTTTPPPDDRATDEDGKPIDA